MPTQPSNANPCDPAKQQQRQEFLDALYRQSGRDRRGSNGYSTYTGLYQEWTQQQSDAES